MERQIGAVAKTASCVGLSEKFGFRRGECETEEPAPSVCVIKSLLKPDILEVKVLVDRPRRNDIRIYDGADVRN